MGNQPTASATLQGVWHRPAPTWKCVIIRTSGAGESQSGFYFVDMVAKCNVRISSVRFHDLRHTFATRMANAGMEMQELAKILGHTDISMTYRYYHLTKKVNDKMRDILNKRAAMK